MPISARAWEMLGIEFSVQNRNKRKPQEANYNKLVE